MSFLRHITACNTHDLSRYRPFFVAGYRVGHIRADLFQTLLGVGNPFVALNDGLSLPERYRTPADRTAVMRTAVERLAAMGAVPPLRGEEYDVVTHWGAEPLMRLDRGAVSSLGVKGFGLHVNGFVRRDDPDPGRGLHLWVGIRAKDRAVAPGKYDNLVAGGQPAGLTLEQNLLKEGAEEAGLPPDLARRAVPVGFISYLMENKVGLKDDTMFCFDLELPPDFIPRNTDGEVERFELWPAAEVAESIQSTDRWKFNVNLVVTDFLIRHGVIGPDHPEYLALAKGLRR